MRESQPSEQCGGQQFKVRHDIVGKSVTGEDSAVYVDGVNTGRELAPSRRVKRASPMSVRIVALSVGSSVTRARDALIREVRGFFRGRCAVE